MNSTIKSSTLARALAPEDVRAGQFVAELSCVEDSKYHWCADCGSAFVAREPRAERLPKPGSGPMRVEGVCAPFVLVRTPAGKARMLDLRRVRLARLDPRFAWAAFRALAASVK